MADTITTLTNELTKVGLAHDSIKTCVYDSVEDYIQSTHDITYPLLLIDNTHLFTVDMKGNRHKYKYQLKFFFWDTYQREEIADKAWNVKQQELIKIAGEYFTELKDRFLNKAGVTPLDIFFDFENIQGLQVKTKHKDMVAQIHYEPTFTVFVDCPSGSFTY